MEVFVRYAFEQRKRAVEFYIECGRGVSVDLLLPSI